MLHMKSYHALQITNGKNSELDAYRIGLIVYMRDGKKMYFTNLNEAITEEITKRFVSKFFNNPIFSKERKQTKNVIAKYPQIITDSGEFLFNNDTFYAKEFENKKSLLNGIAGFIFGTTETKNIIRPKS